MYIAFTLPSPRPLPVAVLLHAHGRGAYLRREEAASASCVAVHKTSVDQAQRSARAAIAMPPPLAQSITLSPGAILAFSTASLRTIGMHAEPV